MRLFLSLLLLFPISLLAAVGDITGAYIEHTGWQMTVGVAGFQTNGVRFYSGFGDNGTLTATNNLTLTITSYGFDSSGEPTTFERTIYGTTTMRLPYANDGLNDALTNGVDGVWAKVALSDFVYVTDSNLVVTIRASSFMDTNAGVGNVESVALVVTNQSTRIAPIPVANWSWPGFNQATGTTMRLRAVGFCQTADNGQPLAGIRFIVSQTNGTKVTNFVSQMTIDRTTPDAIPIPEYIATFNLSDFASYTSGGDNGLLMCDFEAVPRIGDTNSVFYTTPGNGLTPQAATQTNLCDRLGNYGSLVAVVDPSGNDTTGLVTNAAPQTVSYYFATIRGAAAKIAATNNAATGHNDPGGGIIYVRAGITNWAGAGSDITSTPYAWLTILPYPGDTLSPLNNFSGSYYTGHRVKFHQMELGGGLGANLFFGVTGIWMDQCTIDSTSANFCRSALWFVTDCTVPRLTQGLGYAAGVMPAIIRGNRVGSLVGSYKPVHVIIGNLQTSNNLATLIFDFSGQSTPLDYGAIVYNNKFNFHIPGAYTRVTGPEYFNLQRGIAIVQNVFASSTNDSGALFSMGSLDVALTNVILWNNLFLGQRTLLFYNWDTADDGIRWQCQMLNNVADDYNCKTDVTNPSPSGTRTNNWEQIWGVNWEGNIWAETTNASAAPADFMNIDSGGFAGLNTIEHTTVYSPFWPRFTDRQAYDGATVDWIGEGNYRLLSDSPLWPIKARWVLPFDIEGLNRGKNDSAGPYSSGNVRKGIW